VINRKSAGSGGDGGIRTLGKVYTLRRFSKPLVSATHPRLQRDWQERPIASGFDGGNAYSEPSLHHLMPCFDSSGRKLESGHRRFIVHRLTAAIEFIEFCEDIDGDSI
jgi:hypothetical protein